LPSSSSSTLQPDTGKQRGIALAHLNAGRLREAERLYLSLIAEAPDDPELRFHCSLAQIRDARGSAALEHTRHLLAAHADWPGSHAMHGEALLSLGDYAGALCEYDWILARLPQDPLANLKRGFALAALGKLADAQASFEEAREADETFIEKFCAELSTHGDSSVDLCPSNIFLWRRYVAQGACDWTDWTGYLAEFRSAISRSDVQLDPALAFVAFHLPLSASEQHATARRIASRIERATTVLPPPPIAKGPKIRVGILSPDFREHLNAYLLLPLFELLDRRRFELHAYSLAPDSDSDIVRRLKKAAEGFVQLTTMSDTAAASRIRQDGIDILVDVGGHSTGGRFAITAQRPARIQVMYLGFPGSIGSRRADYAIVDRVVAPPQSPEEWTEMPVYLPSTYYLYDFRVDAPDIALSRRDYGLPEEAFVYCAFHKAEKITPDAFDAWMRILRSVASSVIWFLALPAAAIASLRAAAEARGVDPSRLHFAPFDPRARYLARQRLGDLMLDCLHHSAMTTACDALAAGLPVLTVKGQSMASRAGESLLHAAGLPELVATDAEAFSRQATMLARDPHQLGALRRKLKRNRYSAPLFDTAERVRQLDVAFERMHQQALRGETPASFSIGDR
jgi:protein O-GlcNAc transferase